MRIIAAILASTLISAAPALAETYTANTSLAEATRLVKHINAEEMKAIVVANGYTINSVDTSGDEPIVIGQTAEGLFFVLKGQVCNLEGYVDCLGLSIEVRYDADDRVTDANISKANWDYAATKVVRGPNESGADTVFILNYAILDEGQTMGNLATILSNVLAIAPSVVDIIWPE